MPYISVPNCSELSTAVVVNFSIFLIARLICDAFHTWQWLKAGSSNPLPYNLACF